jgi:hypothetical protein
MGNERCNVIDAPLARRGHLRRPLLHEADPKKTSGPASEPNFGTPGQSPALPEPEHDNRRSMP